MNFESTVKFVNDTKFQKCLEIPGFVMVDGKAMPTAYLTLSQPIAEQLFDSLVAIYGNMGVELDDMDFQVAIEGSNLIFLLNPQSHMVH